MKKRNLSTIIFVLLGTLIISCKLTPTTKKNEHSIIIEVEINKYFYYQLTEILTARDEIKIRYTPLQNTSLNPLIEYVSSQVIDGKASWILNSDKPIIVSPPFGRAIIMNPGDSLHITYHGDAPIYSGRKQQSLALLDTLMILDERLVKPRIKYSYTIATPEDYFEWNQYLDNQLAQQLPAIELYKDKIPSIEYDYYKSTTIGKIEANRLKAFGALYGLVHRGYPGLSTTNLAKIWDTTQNKESRLWFKSLPTYYGSIYDFHPYLQLEIRRQFGFNFQEDSLLSNEIFTQLQYNNAKQNYKGLVRERLMAFIIDEQTITEMGLKNPMALALLKDYYSQPGYPEFKAWIKELEKKRQQRELEKEKKKKEKQEG